MFYTSLEEHGTVAFLKVEIMTQEDLDKIRSGGVVKLLDMFATASTTRTKKIFLIDVM